MSYHQLTLEQRYQIEALLAIRVDKAEIARQVGCHRSTLYRELKRNGSGGRVFRYKARTAQNRTDQRRKEKGADCRKIVGELRDLVESKLWLSWSPEQISGRLRRELDISVSHETIYQHVIRDYRAGGRLRYALRFGGYKHFRCTATAAQTQEEPLSAAARGPPPEREGTHCSRALGTRPGPVQTARPLSPHHCRPRKPIRPHQVDRALTGLRRTGNRRRTQALPPTQQIHHERQRLRVRTRRRTRGENWTSPSTTAPQEPPGNAAASRTPTASSANTSPGRTSCRLMLCRTFPGGSKQR